MKWDAGPRSPTYVVWALTVVVLALIGVATLRSEGALTHAFDWHVLEAGDVTADSLRNIVLFMPFGFLAARLTRGTWRVVALAAVVSLSIELAQQWIPGRDPSIDDVVTNTLGAALGAVAFVRRGAWMRGSGRLAVAAACGATAILALGALLLRPSFPPGNYEAVWSPVAPVREVTLAGRVIGDSTPADLDAVMAQIAGGDTLRLRVASSPGASGWDRILEFDTPSDTSLIFVGVLDGRLFLFYRMQAVRFGLDQPEILLGSMPSSLAGDTTRLAIWRSGAGYCRAVNADTECGFGMSVAAPRTLLWYNTWESLTRRRLLDWLWLGLVVAPVGFWMTAGPLSLAAVGIVISSVAALPRVLDLLPTSGAEWLIVCLALVAGAAGRRALSWLSADHP